jgi:catechol 2,3-dioxygenase-like lactoylglutathione lyase family enzyme
MSHVTQVSRVMVPVADQDAAIEFYTRALSFELVADVPFGDGDRWVEVAPPGGGAALALVPPRGDYQTGRMTGIALATTDADAAHDALKGKGVDVDAEMMGGDGTVPKLFFFRDHDANTLMIVESASTVRQEQ